MLGQEGLFGLEHFVGGIPHGAGHPHGAVVSQVAADLPHNHGYQVGAGEHIQVHIEIVNAFDEAHASHLEQIVRVFVAAIKLFDDTEHQAEISLDQLFPGFLAPRPGLQEEFLGLLPAEYRQFGRVDSADFYLATSSHGDTSPAFLVLVSVSPGEKPFIPRQARFLFLSFPFLRWIFLDSPWEKGQERGKNPCNSGEAMVKY